jgi:nucleoside-diphosphate-sugar epimerase
VVRRLLAAGHEVVGLTRSPEHAAALAAAGVEPSLADALDVQAVRAAVLAARPHAVLHLLTGLAGRPLRRASDLEETNALRTAGTRFLLDAAAAAGARRFVAESMVLVYGYGDLGPRPLTEDDPPRAVHPDRAVQAAVDALRGLETQLAEASRAFRVEGVALRFGLFRGPGASDGLVRALRRGVPALVAGGGAVIPAVHVEDAADAVVAALDRGRSGEAYNVADPGAATLAETFASVARAAGAPPPRSIPAWVARVVAPYAAVVSATRLVVSSEKARRELGWEPRHAP